MPLAIVAALVTFAYTRLNDDDSGASPNATPTASVGLQTTEAPDASTPPHSANTQATPSLPRSGSTPIVQMEGIVRDSFGEPVQGAILANGVSMVVTGEDGIFAIGPGEGPVTVRASGYLATSFQPTDASEVVEITLETQKINALYFNPNMSGNEEGIQRIIGMIDSTRANAVVIDIKEEIIYYDSEVPLFVEAGTVRPIMDMAALVERFRSHGIYTIARLVVFKDGLIAQDDPDLAVLNSQTGNLWRDDNGVAWVNPMEHLLWDSNIELAIEAAGFGFDEIQYDYVRFPTDGDFSTVNFGLENTQENRQNAINGFLEESHQALAPLGVRQSADVFGFTLLVDDDLGIGQNFPLIAQHVDYISPMIYPSHWPEGSLAVDGHPNSFPYETIEISLQLASEKLGGDLRKVRPWLQDFSFPNLLPYGAHEVREQIRAVEETDASGWMLWDPNNQYTPEAFPDDATLPATPASGQALIPAAVSESLRGNRSAFGDAFKARRYSSRL